jgi:hypothetical protein
VVNGYSSIISDKPEQIAGALNQRRKGANERNQEGRRAKGLLVVRRRDW